MKIQAVEKNVIIGNINRHMRLRFIGFSWLSASLLLAVPGVLGCHYTRFHGHPEDFDEAKRLTCPSEVSRMIQASQEMKRFASEMDKVSREIEEWGTLTISAPIIANNQGQFEFDPGVTAKDLYLENRTEGAVSLRTARATMVGVSFDTKKLVDNVIGNLAALERSDDASDQIRLKFQIVEALKKLANSPEGQAIITGLMAGRPELVGFVNSILAMGAEPAGKESKKKDHLKRASKGNQSDESGDPDEDDGNDKNGVEGEPNGEPSDDMESSPGEKLAEDGSGSPSDTAADVVGKFSEMLGTFPSDELLRLNPRRRLRLTASDFWEFNLHKFFSMPENVGDHFKPVFVTFTVSCHPGWRTRQGFAGVVDVRVEFMYVNDEGESIPLSPHPSGRTILPIAGIYPAYDTQELNLRNSQRELQAFAFNLAAAGQLAAAKVFLDAARLREEDAETNTGISTTTGYSIGGQGFGYEFRPTFRALGQPGKTKARPDFILEPISFPAVAVVLIDKEWLIKELARLRHATRQHQDLKSIGCRASAYVDANCEDAKNKSLKELEPLLQDVEMVFQVTHTWRPLKGPLMVDVPGMGRIGRWLQPRLREQDFAKRLNALGVAYSHLEGAFCKGGDYKKGVIPGELGRVGNRYACEHLRKRWLMLASQGVNFQTPYKIAWRDFAPTLLPPKITSVRPKEARFDADTEIVIEGANLGSVQGVYVGGVKCAEFKAIGSKVIVAMVPAGTDKLVGAKHDLIVISAEGSDTLEEGITFVRKNQSPTISSISPSLGWIDAETAIVIQGVNLSSVEHVYVGGVVAKFEQLGSTTVVATVPKDTYVRSDLKHNVTVVTGKGSATVVDAISFVRKETQSTTPMAPTINVGRDSDGRVNSITINQDALKEKKDANLLDALRAIMANENCCEGASVNIKCTTSKSDG